jgi:scyllo-inositol 2-dehydrogenase (NADP+)
VKTLNTALIGLGRIGWKYHLPQIVQHDGFNLRAVVDPLQERLKEAEKNYRVNGFKDCTSLFASGEKIDLVVIASPSIFHCEQTLLAFDNGCDVFCDKPMAVSYKESLKMYRAAKKTGRKLMLYQPHRATAEFLSLRYILNTNLIGEIYMIKRIHTDYRRRNDWQAFKNKGGGMLNNYGAHFLDQLLLLSSSRAREVLCSVMQRVVSIGDAEDFVKILMRTENGILLDLEINQASAFIMPSWQIAGKRGSILLNREEKTWYVRYIPAEELPDLTLQKTMAAENRQYRSGDNFSWHEKKVHMDDFTPIDYYEKCYEYFALGKKPFVPLEETIHIMHIFEICRNFKKKTLISREF